MNREERIQHLKFDYPTRESLWIDTCNLCGSDGWTVITHRDRYGFPAQTAVCGRCGLAMLNPRMTAESYSDFYAHWYRPLVSAYHGRTIDAVTIQQEQQNYAEEMERLVSPFLEECHGQTFLDVGGSTGIVAMHFARVFGLMPTVIDPAPAEIVEAERFGLKTVTGFIENWDHEDLRFDVVGMFQTVDHLLDIKTTLEKIRLLIRPKGVFLLDIVDFRAAYLKNWSVEQATKIDHPFGLTEFTMESYLAQTGFRPVRKAYSADHHLVAYVCVPVEPLPDYLPNSSDVRSFFWEIRYVQNTPGAMGRIP